MKYILIKEAPRALQRFGLDTSEMGGFVQELGIMLLQ